MKFNEDLRVKIPAILDVYDENNSSIFKKQDLIELENQQLTKLRDWILPMLMNGQVSVKEVEVKMNIAAETREKYNP